MSSDSFGRFGYELYPHENPAEATPCVLVRQIKEYVSYLFQKLRLSLNDANRLLSETVGGRRVGDFEGNEGSGREAVENEERWTGNEENGQTGVGIKERRSCVDRDREPEESPGNYLKDQDKSFSRQPARLYLCLIVGRGTNSGAWWLKDGASPSASRSKQDKDEEGGGGNDAQFYTLTRISSFNALTLTIYIHCDKFGGAFATRFSSSTPTKSTTSNSYAATIPPPPHLWLDFNNLNALRAIPTDFFDAIVVDWSTWRYMMPSAPGVIEEWSRILRGSTAVNEEVGKEDGGRHCLNPLGLKSGTLVFEGGISSVKVVPDESSMGKASTAQSNTTLERPSSSVSSEALYDSESPKRADRREHHISIEYDFNNPTHATVPFSLAQRILQDHCKNSSDSDFNTNSFASSSSSSSALRHIIHLSSFSNPPTSISPFTSLNLPNAHHSPSYTRIPLNIRKIIPASPLSTTSPNSPTQPTNPISLQPRARANKDGAHSTNSNIHQILSHSPVLLDDVERSYRTIFCGNQHNHALFREMRVHKVGTGQECEEEGLDRGEMARPFPVPTRQPVEHWVEVFK